jgi:DNA polymerase-3 subunit gamma/tau
MPSYLVLARKYRPATFSEVVGQSHVVQALTNSILSGRVAHAFLFCGVRGVGKTTVARILAKSLNCTNRPEDRGDPCDECSSCREIANGISVDVQEIDGASHTSVENIREINENIKYPPVTSPFKIIIIDEVHMISISAFNALLKTLEEPPAHAKFIFATTESHKVPATINSRCQRFNFRTISMVDMIAGMSRILEQEGIEASEEALAQVAREAQGSFRDALSLLDQVIAFSTGCVTLNDVEATLGIVGREAFGRLVQAILERDAAGALRLVHDLFNGGYDPEQLALDMIDYLRGLIVVATVPAADRPEGMVDAAPAELEEMERLSARAGPEELQYMFEMLMRGEGEIRRAGNPWVVLEMTVIRMATAPDIVDLSEILRRIESAPPSTERRRPSRSPQTDKPSSEKPRRSAFGSGPQVAQEETASVERGETVSGSEQASETEPGAEPNQSPEETSAGPPYEQASEGFVITRITPVPEESPEELWAAIKTEVGNSGLDPMLSSMMEHGRIISVGPTLVEIGFHKTFYRDEFENRLESRPAVKKIFEDFLGDARIKVLTLTQPTSLDTEKPYMSRSNGETDRTRALKQEALEHPIVAAVQEEFEDTSIDDIKIL